MKVLIIEDEPLAATRLQRLLQELDETITFPGVLHSAAAAIDWLKTHPAPDLIFLDIELTDSTGFSIFEKIEVFSPIIFTTSYDQFALKAFEVNSIDYLLKPIKKSELQDSLVKFHKIRKQLLNTLPAFDATGLLNELKRNQNAALRERFLVKVGQRYIAVEVSDIAYFFIEGRLTNCLTWSGVKYVIDYTLEEIEKMLDVTTFFQANRSFIVSKKAVVQVYRALNGKLRVMLHPPSRREVIVSKEKAKEFKNWLGK